MRWIYHRKTRENIDIREQGLVYKIWCEDSCKKFSSFCKYCFVMLHRFGVVEDKRNISRLFVIMNPINYKQHKSYIQHWTGPSFSLTHVACAGEALSALAVSKCGRYVAIGSMTTGDVDIYIAYSLQVNLNYIMHCLLPTLSKR